MTTENTGIWNTVNWTTPVIFDHGSRHAAAAGLVAYFAVRHGDTGPRYTGSMFTELGGGGDRPEVATVITAEDIVAVSTLSVDIRPLHSLQLLGQTGTAEGMARTAEWRRSDGGVPYAGEVPIDAVEISRLLAELPTDVDLVDATDRDLEVAELLWREVRRKGLGRTRASKLLARKRPRLLPVIDRVVCRELGHTRGRTDFYLSLRAVLRDGELGLPDRLAGIRRLAVEQAKAEDDPAAAERIGHLSDLRVFDIVLWMAGR